MSQPTDEAPACWVGRMRIAGRAVSVRCRDTSGPPSASKIVDVIDDPFDSELNFGDCDPWLAATQAEARAQVRVGDHLLLAPVRPGKVIGIGRNYVAHAAELGNEIPTSPLVFLKASSCLTAHESAIELPRGYERIDLEGELVAVIGRAARRVSASDAWQHVAGWTLGNDISNRDLQKQDKQWTRAKGFDGSGPCGPWIRMNEPGFVPPIDSMCIVSEHNGHQVQYGRASDMIFSLPTLIEFLSESMTLMPGDLLYTGTPEGVTPIVPGSSVVVRCLGLQLGELRNTFT